MISSGRPSLFSLSFGLCGQRGVACFQSLTNSTLQCKVYAMDSTRAAEHLQVIRTLMERSAVYRRALAPVMIFAGSLGLLAGVLGWRLSILQPRAFVTYWYSVAAAGAIGAFLMVRRQAWQQAEPFWSPPTRRVAQAILPPLTAGFLLGVMAVAATKGTLMAAHADSARFIVLALPLAWIVLYGCALHASGFFMTRGMRLFGWLVMAGGCAAFSFLLMTGQPPSDQALLELSHGLMGFFFGALHLAYGVYLYFTEPRRNET